MIWGTLELENPREDSHLLTRNLLLHLLVGRREHLLLLLLELLHGERDGGRVGRGRVGVAVAVAISAAAARRGGGDAAGGGGVRAVELLQ